MADDSGMRQGQSRARWSAGLLASGEGARRQWTPVPGRVRSKARRQAKATAALAKLGSGSGLLRDSGVGACGGAGQTQGNGSSGAA